MRTLLVIVVLGLSACASSSRSVRFGDRLLAADEERAVCAPTLFAADTQPKAFLAVGRVEAESRVGPEGLQETLLKQACKLGANGLIHLRQDSYDTVRSQLDPQTRESRIGAGPKIHIAQALAVFVQDPTPVSDPDAELALEPPSRACQPCPVCSLESSQPLLPPEEEQAPLP